MGNNKNPRGNMPNMKHGFLWGGKKRQHNLLYLLIYYLFLILFMHSPKFEFLSEIISLPTGELLFSISCRAGQMVTNPLSFSYFKVRSLFHHYYWNIYSSRLIISLSTHCLLASMGFDETSVVIQMIVHLYKVCISLNLSSLGFTKLLEFVSLYLLPKFGLFSASISLNIFSVLVSLSSSVIPVSLC